MPGRRHRRFTIGWPVMTTVGEPPIAGRSVDGAAPRLDLHHDPSVRTMLDGVWRPRSWDTAHELAELIAALDASQNRPTLIMLNPVGWQGHPRRVEVAGRTVRVAWFTDLDASVLMATTNSYQRIDLLVRVPDVPVPAPRKHMRAADGAAPRDPMTVRAPIHPIGHVVAD
jgi:uncharacterized protein DUF5994